MRNALLIIANQLEVIDFTWMAIYASMESKYANFSRAPATHLSTNHARQYSTTTNNYQQQIHG